MLNIRSTVSRNLPIFLKKNFAKIPSRITVVDRTNPLFFETSISPSRKGFKCVNECECSFVNICSGGEYVTDFDLNSLKWNPILSNLCSSLSAQPPYMYILTLLYQLLCISSMQQTQSKMLFQNYQRQ